MGWFMNIDITEFSEAGLYLLLPDGERLVLTRDSIEKTTRRMLDDPRLISPHMRAAVEYKPCDICPARFTAEICHAIMPALQFCDDIDRYMSYDKVTAIYREDEDSPLMVNNTTMTDALQFVTILSLTSYCEVGEEYGRYFVGINPLMPLEKIGREVFLNVYCEAKGDRAKTKQIITTMSENILHTARCQAARLNLISQRDAFINAFVNTELIFQYVHLELIKYLDDS